MDSGKKKTFPFRITFITSNLSFVSGGPSNIPCFATNLTSSGNSNHGSQSLWYKKGDILFR